jgi:hypothetical protein
MSGIMIVILMYHRHMPMDLVLRYELCERKYCMFLCNAFIYALQRRTNIIFLPQFLHCLSSLTLTYPQGAEPYKPAKEEIDGNARLRVCRPSFLDCFDCVIR